VVKVGNLALGGNNPILVQSMTNTDPHDARATLAQVETLSKAGCDIIRLTAPTLESLHTFAAIKEAGITTPLVADIHFDARIALEAVAVGVDKIRINPGNIGDADRVRAVARACREKGVPIRIGVNSGSVEKHLLAKFGGPTPEALAESALYHASLLESVDFTDIVLSVKASNPYDMICASRILAERTSYPLHLGVTEAGGGEMGRVKGAVCIGTLLAEGIGDTIRVSLTADPLEEVTVARQILSSLGLNPRPQMNIVACPTCGRTRFDLMGTLAAFEAAVDREGLRSLPVKVAIMGCVVNGPGEARDADLGIAGGEGCAVLFSHGEIIGKYPQNIIVDKLIEELKEQNK
jgi:(E)-4-hydroxy-3-methylbut-2-enyl-diphosphate synthase